MPSMSIVYYGLRLYKISPTLDDMEVFKKIEGYQNSLQKRRQTRLNIFSRPETSYPDSTFSGCTQLKYT